MRRVDSDPTLLSMLAPRRLKAPQRRYVFRLHPVARRYVVPSDHEFAACAQVLPASGECGFCVSGRVKAPPEHAVTDDHVEILRLYMVRKVLESIDDVPLAAVEPTPWHWIDGPVFAINEQLAVALRVGSAADEQHAMSIAAPSKTWQNLALQHASVFADALRGSTEHCGKRPTYSV